MLLEKPSGEFMSLAPWRSSIAHALYRNRSLAYCKFVQMATVRPDGHPSNRTVVFRDFWEKTNQLKFITDFRSQKIADIYDQPWTEICWYFPKTREQFRLHGRLALVSEHTRNEELQQLRSQTWRELSVAARAQFSWADPGEPRDLEAPFQMELPNEMEVLPEFCVLLMDPVSVDHLELRGDPQNRTAYKKQADEQWVTIAINP
jgi:pyridoxamine 5'-phosphate oxidase